MTLTLHTCISLHKTCISINVHCYHKSFSFLFTLSSNDMSTYTKAGTCLHFTCTGLFIQWYFPRRPPNALIILCLLCIFISQICLWKVLKKRPVATIKQAHDGEGEVWISALCALRNTDLLASGTSSLLQKLCVYATSVIDIVWSYNSREAITPHMMD